MFELAVEAMKEGEDHLTIANGVAELSKRRGHGFQLTAEVGDGHGAMAKVTELLLQEKGA
jgi:hypothetical protein